jgi:hypothetical protein
MECAFSIDVIFGEGVSIIKLNTRENESLLVRGNTFLVLNDGLEFLYCEVRGDFASDGLASQGLYINLIGARLHHQWHFAKFDLMRYRVDELLRHEEGS